MADAHSENLDFGDSLGLPDFQPLAPVQIYFIVRKQLRSTQLHNGYEEEDADAMNTSLDDALLEAASVLSTTAQRLNSVVKARGSATAIETCCDMPVDAGTMTSLLSSTDDDVVGGWLSSFFGGGNCSGGVGCTEGVVLVG